MTSKRSKSEPGPMTAEEVLRLDNIPATRAMPEEMRRWLQTRRMVISSSAAGFDPRKHFTRVKGHEGAWQLAPTTPSSAAFRCER